VGLNAVVPAPPASLTWGSRTGVYGVLRRTKPTCLERSMVQQRWLSANNIHLDVVVGVASEDARVSAHAWIDGITALAEVHSYREIHRIPANHGQRAG
jgi:hypothetical protein